MEAQAQIEREARQTLLADIRQAYAYARSQHGFALEPQQKAAIENLLLRRIQAVGAGAPNLGPEFRLQGRSEDFEPTDEASDEVQQEMRRLCKLFEQDTIAYGCLAELGTDAYATYAPIHQVTGSSGAPGDFLWGVYISEDKLCRLAAMLQSQCLKDYGEPRKQLFLHASYQILLRYALAHFKLEAFALNAELVRREPIFLRYMANVYLALHRKSECLEDALANATILSSQKVNKIFAERYPAGENLPGLSRCEWRRILKVHLFSCQPPGYQNHEFRDRWRKGGQPVDNVRRFALNYLCNQIISGEIEPKVDVPFFAFPPDNYFLRGDILVPIHILRARDGVRAFTKRKRRR